VPQQRYIIKEKCLHRHTGFGLGGRLEPQLSHAHDNREAKSVFNLRSAALELTGIPSRPKVPGIESQNC